MSMGLLSRLGVRPSPRPQRNGSAFPAADMGRLTASWTTDPGSINRWARYELRTLRARSRQLARGDAYGAKFITACVKNIAGPHPFQAQVKAKFADGKLNSTANDAIESAWLDRCKVGNLDVTGRLSLSMLHRLVVRTMARDGEVLIRRYRDPEFGAAGRLQIIDVDRLDEEKNENLAGGAIKMGVEVDNFSRPVAYHILRQHPGEVGQWSRGGSNRETDRIPADQIMHLFVSDWPEQVRGIPWMHAAMLRLWNLGGFEEAAVINARVGASKIAVLQTPDGELPATLATGSDSAGNLLTDSDPGQYWTLPPGVQLNSFNPQFPDAAVGPFIQACLRGVAAAVDMAYHSLANDPGEVNYSTARVALLDERDGWMALQQFYIEAFCQRDFEDWLRGSVLDGKLLPAYYAHRNAVRWQPKRWSWIDPEKEAKAKQIALETKLTSRTRLAAENGEDIEEIFEELAADDELAKTYGVSLEPEPAQGGAMSGQPTEPANSE